MKINFILSALFQDCDLNSVEIIYAESQLIVGNKESPARLQRRLETSRSMDQVGLVQDKKYIHTLIKVIGSLETLLTWKHVLT